MIKPEANSVTAPGIKPGDSPASDTSGKADLLYGANSVREALRKGRLINKVWVAREKNDRISAEVIGLCHKANIPYIKADKPVLDRLSGGAAHQGFIAAVSPKVYDSWRDMIKLASDREQAPVIALLDAVEDPRNLGAALRCVDAFGAHGAVITKHRSAPLTSGAANASAGALEYVMVDRVTNMSRTIEDMKTEGLWVIGATADAERSIYSVDWTGPVALVLGGESKGLTPLIRAKCDILARIPMSGQVNSLNVSAALAVILSEINRQRSQSKQSR